MLKHEAETWTGEWDSGREVGGSAAPGRAPRPLDDALMKFTAELVRLERQADSREPAPNVLSDILWCLRGVYEELNAEAAPRAADPPPLTWQPIETAPKDGTPFWAHGPVLVDLDFNPTGSVECCFDGERFVGAVWDGQHDIWRTDFIEFTHWMALPAPPEEKQR